MSPTLIISLVQTTQGNIRKEDTKQPGRDSMGNFVCVFFYFFNVLETFTAVVIKLNEILTICYRKHQSKEHHCR